VSLVRDVQSELHIALHIAYTEVRYTDEDIDEPDRRRLRLPCETQTYELTGFDPEDAGDLSRPICGTTGIFRSTSCVRAA